MQDVQPTSLIANSWLVAEDRYEVEKSFEDRATKALSEVRGSIPHRRTWNAEHGAEQWKQGQVCIHHS